jgi:general secretion pathway protein C
MNARLTDWLRQGRWTTLLDLALVVALGAAAAHWTWILIAPHPLALPAHASAVETAAGPIVARGLFGEPGGTSAHQPALNLKLVGVFAPRAHAAGSPGRAVFTLATGETTSVAEGESVSPGVVLREVHPDHVLVTRDGVVQQIALDRPVADLSAKRTQAAGGSAK